MMKYFAALVVGVVLSGCASTTTSDDATKYSVHPKGQVRWGNEIDPVCGMEVNPSSAERERFQGRTWYFCNSDCEARFKSAPAAYLEPVHPQVHPDAEVR